MIRTKKQLLAAIAKGPASVELIYATTLYRVAVPEDNDPASGIWIRLGPDDRFIVEDYAEVRAHIDGRDLRLTHAEIDSIVALIAKTMRMRQQRPSNSRATAE